MLTNQLIYILYYIKMKVSKNNMKKKSLFPYLSILIAIVIAVIMFILMSNTKNYLLGIIFFPSIIYIFFSPFFYIFYRINISNFMCKKSWRKKMDCFKCNDNHFKFSLFLLFYNRIEIYIKEVLKLWHLWGYY